MDQMTLATKPKMLLNEISVLDKGHVALLSSSNSGVKLKELSDQLFGSLPHYSFLEIANATLIVKCPLFVQLKLSQYGFTIIQAPHKGDVEAFLPDMTDVQAPVREDSETIADDIMRTTEALLINPKSYQADGCNEFVSQVITPINVYTTLVVHGTLAQWIHYLNSSDKVPDQVKKYNEAIKQVISNEWKNYNAFSELAKKRYGTTKEK